MDAPYCTLGIQKVKDPREYGVVEFDIDGEDPSTVIRVVEKPKIPKSNMAMVGFYKIKNVDLLIEALNYNIDHNIRTKGEFPLTDALMRMIEQGIIFKTIQVDNWYNCGKKEVLLEANSILLNKKEFASTDLPTYDNSIIIPPVSIGHNCRIENSIIGPHVTIGDNARINNAILKDSIIGNFASIQEVVLQKSVIGNDTMITGLRQSLNIGDNTEIDFSTPG